MLIFRASTALHSPNPQAFNRYCEIPKVTGRRAGRHTKQRIPELEQESPAGGGLPAGVRLQLNETPEWKNARVVAGFFEHGTELDTQRGPSSNDLLVVCDSSEGLGVIAAEAKAGESFGQLVDDWKNSPGKEARYAWACEQFGVDPATCGALRWQLFHRTLSAVLETKRFCSKHAMMLVHDFCPQESWADEFSAFSLAIGLQDTGIGRMSSARIVQDVSLRLGWVRDSPEVGR